LLNWRLVYTHRITGVIMYILTAPCSSIHTGPINVSNKTLFHHRDPLYILLFLYLQLRIQSIYNNRLLKLLKVLKEAFEQVDRVLDVVSTAGLANAVHAQLRVAEVKRAGAHGCR
jgi:hypothetical protein